MPDMSVEHPRRPERFLLVGPIGGGKTSLSRTIPGRKFVYVFDPNTINSYRVGDNIGYEEFLPDILELDVITLSKGKRDREVKVGEPKTYIEWEKDFYNRLETGFFSDPGVEIDGLKGGFDVIGFDSLTTFSDIVMDRILYLQGRPGKFPEQDDWAAQINTITNIFRTATALGKVIFATAHDEYIQDKDSRRMINRILLTGRLRVRLPILFSEIYRCTSDCQQDTDKFDIQTRPDKTSPTVRCSLGFKMYEEVTIGEGNPESHGIGKLLKVGGKT